MIPANLNTSAHFAGNVFDLSCADEVVDLELIIVILILNFSWK